MRNAALAGAGALAALAIAGCGGSDEVEGIDDAFQDQVNAICATYEERFADVGIELAQELDKGDAVAVQAQADEFAMVVADLITELDGSIGEIPEGDAGPIFADFIAAYEESVALTSQIAETAADGDDISQLRDQLEDVAARQAEDAERLGLSDCAG